MKAKKSWREKLADSKGLPKVAEVTGKMSKKWGSGRMVIPAPSEVNQLMKKVPKGRVVTINELRSALAANHRADFACPLTTGIFSWIAAHAAAEAEAEGKTRITPYWRTLKNGGELNPKYPGGAEGVAKRLRAEGHKIIHKGKRSIVSDYERYLFHLVAMPNKLTAKTLRASKDGKGLKRFRTKKELYADLGLH